MQQQTESRTDHRPRCPLACRTGPFSTPLGTNTPEFLQSLREKQVYWCEIRQRKTFRTARLKQDYG